MAGLLSGITDAVGLTDSGAVDAAMGKASGYMKEQLKRLAEIDLPDIEKQKILLENPELVGLLEAEQIGDSALEEISLDPAAREAQLTALSSLQEYADEGLTDTDKYAMEQLLGDVAAQEQSRQAGVEADMARKGMDSSGAAIMAKMNAGQQGANQAREQAMQMAAQGSENRMAALNQLAGQSANMQQADYARQANAASAKDAIARSNAANRQNVNAANLASRQAIENQRAGTSNQQQMYNKGLQQQQFQNEMSKAGAQNTASGNLANMYAQQGQAQAAADSNTMGTLGKLGAAYMTGGASLAAEDGGIARAEDGGVISEKGYGSLADYGNHGYDNIYSRTNKMTPEAASKRNKILRQLLETKTPEEISNDRFSDRVNLTSDEKLLLAQESMKKHPEGSRDHDYYKGIIIDNIEKGEQYEDGGVPQYASDGLGDIIDSGMDSFADDRVDAKVNDGEAIINIPQQQRFMDLVRGKIGVDELGSDDIVEGVPREYSEDLHEKLESDSSGQSDRVRGLERLIDMLGKE